MKTEDEISIPALNAGEWDDMLAGFPNAHLLQTWEWGQSKAANGWKMLPQVWRDEAGNPAALAMVLKRPLSRFLPGINVLYVPRGPIMDWSNAELRRRVLADLQLLARKQASIQIKMDPELVMGAGIPGTENDRENETGKAALTEMLAGGWQYSVEQVQFKNTAFLNLEGTEDDWLERMKQKTRYNLRLAQKKGVMVRPGNENDLPRLYRLYAETSLRDGFVIRLEDYYLHLWRAFMDAGMAVPLVAEVDGETVAGLMLFAFGRRAWYLFGMSGVQHREKMPNYLLQWEAMRQARRMGCLQYDLWGAPDVFDESDSMWGVFRFKEGLGGQVVRTAGAWDYAPRAWQYGLYHQVLPRLLDVMRGRGFKRTQSEQKT